MVAHPISNVTSNGNFNSPYHQNVGRVFYGLLPDRRDSIQRVLDDAETNGRVLSVYQGVVAELLDQYVRERRIEPKLRPLAEAVGMMDTVRDAYEPIISVLPEAMAKIARRDLGY